jgi:ABC-type transport system substrate-binding protein
MDSGGNVAPLLCDRWVLEDEARTVRLTLRPGIVFSDGTPLTAATVKSSLERSIRRAGDSMPAALEAIRGVPEFLAGKAPEVEGIRAPSGLELEIRLHDPLPIFPSLLTDGRTAIVAERPDGSTVGTGPFLRKEHTAVRAILERNAQYWREPSRLDRVEFRASLPAADIAQGLRAGRLDLARDLLPQDLEAILREPRFRAGLVETPKKNTYFVMFHAGSPAGSNLSFRRALAGAVRSQDFVWGALGRFAMPATGVIPPGILGHDPGRRQSHVSREKTLELIRASGLPAPIRLRAAVHPILQDQYAALTQELFRIWGDLGVEVQIATHSMPEYLDRWHAKEGIDLIIGRWIADYDDPDNFTFGLIHSATGLLRAYYSSPEADRILEEARSEPRPSVRESLYRKFEHDLLESGIFIPLFHDVDYRIAAPAARGVQLRSTAPYVNYAEIGKAEAPAVRAAPEAVTAGGTVQVAISGAIRDLDPSLAETLEQTEVLTGVFETLTWAHDGVRVAPWLASEIGMEDGGRRVRFRLRPDVRFHDGRRLTARDVRYSFERLLLNEASGSRFLLSTIRGAKRLLDGSGSDLEGFHIVSNTEFFVDLDKPVSFFPAVVSFAATAIVPEGTRRVGSSWKEGAVGTGPYRVVSFEPGRRTELERNPHYWREGFPHNEGVVFRFGATPEEIRDEFLAGRLSVAMELLPADAESLRHDPRFAAGYRESPRLTTYFAVFNRHHGILKDAETRRSLVRAVDVASLARRTLGRLAIPAHGLIPPGLLGHSAVGERSDRSVRMASSDSSVEKTVSREAVELTAAVHPVFFGEYAAFFGQLTDALREIGIQIRPVTRTMAEFLEFERKPDADLFVGRWNADYPDADTFVHGVLHSEAGFVGRWAGGPEIDALAEQGRAETDPRVRHSIYRQVEEIVARDALLLPLFHEQVYCFARPDVEGLGSLGSAPVVRYDNLWVRR